MSNESEQPEMAPPEPKIIRGAIKELLHFLGLLLLAGAAAAGILIAMFIVIFHPRPVRNLYDLTPKDLAKQGTSLGHGYEAVEADGGDYTNAHGLQSHLSTRLIARRTANGKRFIVWPDTLLGWGKTDNAAVIGDAVVFGGVLPTLQLDTGHFLLMASRDALPTLVIHTAALRLAAERLGPVKVVPGRRYAFALFQTEPEKVVLKGTGALPHIGDPDDSFTLELNAADITALIDETRRLGSTQHKKRFDYVVQPGDPLQVPQPK